MNDGYYVSFPKGVEVFKETEKAYKIGYSAGTQKVEKLNRFGDSVMVNEFFDAQDLGWIPKSQTIIKDDKIFTKPFIINEKIEDIRISNKNLGSKKAIETGKVFSQNYGYIDFLKVEGGKIVENVSMPNKITKTNIQKIIDGLDFAKYPKTSETIVKTAISQLAIKTNENNGKKSIWVSSEALDNREEHIPFYGEFIGEDTDNVIPGQEFGCQCGVGYE